MNEPTPKKETAEMIAVLRVRGEAGINKDIADTLNMLCLYKRNFCSVHKNSASLTGMLKKCKDYVTWGIINEDTLKKLVQKRAEKNPKDESKTKKFFRLNSPKKGYGRKGIKTPFSLGGALGNRADKINDLIERMF